MPAPKSLKKIFPALFDRPTQNVDHAKIWRLNSDPQGVLHRDFNRPAIVRENGSREWWVEGRLHRVGGPAVEDVNGEKQYYLNGVAQTAASVSAAPKKPWWKKKLGL